MDFILFSYYFHIFSLGAQIPILNAPVFSSLGQNRMDSIGCFLQNYPKFTSGSRGLPQVHPEPKLDTNMTPNNEH